VRKFALTVGLTLVLVACAFAQVQDPYLVIPGFTKGIGTSTPDAFFEPYREAISLVVWNLHRDTTLYLLIVGQADGIPYNQNHDAFNVSIALSRAIRFKQYVEKNFDINPERVLTQATTVPERDEKGTHRLVSIYLESGEQVQATRGDLNSLEKRLNTRIDKVEKIAKSKPDSSIIRIENNYYSSIELEICLGAMTLPYGGIVPYGSGRIGTKTLSFEGGFGHSFTTRSVLVNGQDLKTYDRLAYGLLVIQPFKHVPLKFVGGCARFEEKSRYYGKYTIKDEGFVAGGRYYLSVFAFTAMYGRYEDSRSATVPVVWKNVFTCSVAFAIKFGGAK
jgi:hypothetical protein